MRKKEIKDKVTSIRLTSLQLERIRKMAYGLHDVFRRPFLMGRGDAGDAFGGTS